MNFVYPNFLWALFLLLIPIIIHIFSFRRYKTIYFSRVEFLKEIKEDSRTGARLKHLLILASRLFFIAALVFAFAVGVSTYNFGTLMRYKIPVLPFYAIFLIIVIAQKNEK